MTARVEIGQILVVAYLKTKPDEPLLRAYPAPEARARVRQAIKAGIYEHVALASVFEVTKQPPG